MTNININVKGLDVLQKNLKALGSDLGVFIDGARVEITNEILDTKGLRNYPPETSANKPPVPYYIRGRGTQYAFGNAGNSERLGSQWKSVPYGKLGMKIFNDVSYAAKVHGEAQSPNMARIGWAQLFKTAVSKIGTITSIYNKWVDKLIKKHNL